MSMSLVDVVCDEYGADECGQITTSKTWLSMEFLPHSRLGKRLEL